MSIKKIVSVLLVCLSLTSIFVSSVFSEEKPIIRVGSFSLTEQEVLQVLINSTGGNNMATMMTITQADLEKRNIMMNQVAEALLIAEAAKDEGLDSVPDVAFQIKWQTIQVLLREYLKNISEKWDISSKELQKYYESHQEEFVQPEAYHIRHIMSPTKNIANEVLLKVINTNDFVKVAGNFSRDQNTAKTGGDLGWVEKGTQDSAIEKAVFGAKVGSLTGPVKSAYGWHVIEVLAHRPSKQLTFLESEEKVSTRLQMAYVDKEIEKLKQKYNVEIDQKILSNLGGIKIQEKQR